MNLTEEQQNAVDIFMSFIVNKDSKYMVLHGDAGSGKSTMIQELIVRVEKYQEMRALVTKKHKIEKPIIITATTNTAVKVLEKMVNIPVCTIHSLIGLKTKNDYNQGKVSLTLKKNTKPIRDSILIIDEASMINKELFEFIDQQTENCKILFVGDQYQLAPVGETQTIMETLNCPKATLHSVLRNTGSITETGKQFKESLITGVFKPIKSKNSLVCVDGPSFKIAVENCFTNSFYSPENTKILAWTNNKVLQYNTHIRALLGYSKNIQVGEQLYTNKPIFGNKTACTVDSLIEVTGIGTEFKEKEVLGRMIEINNEYMAFLPNDPKAEYTVLQQLAKKRAWKEYFDIKESWLDLRSPYACTVHKAQGNSYNTVFIDLSDMGKCYIATDVARLLYVGITRAIKKVILYGKLPARYSGEHNEYKTRTNETDLVLA